MKVNWTKKKKISDLIDFLFHRSTIKFLLPIKIMIFIYSSEEANQTDLSRDGVSFIVSFKICKCFWIKDDSGVPFLLLSRSFGMLLHQFLVKTNRILSDFLISINHCKTWKFYQLNLLLHNMCYILWINSNVCLQNTLFCPSRNVNRALHRKKYSRFCLTI